MNVGARQYRSISVPVTGLAIFKNKSGRETDPFPVELRATEIRSTLEADFNIRFPVDGLTRYYAVRDGTPVRLENGTLEIVALDL